jgi:hypothetical protein
MKQLPDDFRDFLNILNSRKVKYLIVGGWALGVHGYIRALISALIDFGVPEPIEAKFFKENGNAFRMGSPPMRIEIITEATGIDFESSFLNKVEIETDGIVIPFLGYDDLIKNKHSSGRLKDRADLESLGELD